jgi:hypothetical protein
MRMRMEGKRKAAVCKTRAAWLRLPAPLHTKREDALPLRYVSPPAGANPRSAAGQVEQHNGDGDEKRPSRTTTVQLAPHPRGPRPP